MEWLYGVEGLYGIGVAGGKVKRLQYCKTRELLAVRIRKNCPINCPVTGGVRKQEGKTDIEKATFVFLEQVFFLVDGNYCKMLIVSEIFYYYLLKRLCFFLAISKGLCFYFM